MQRLQTINCQTIKHFVKYFLVIIIFLGLSCKKDKSCEGCLPDPQSQTFNAIILDTGPLAGDGCSWLIAIGDTLRYHPDVLSPAFQQNGLHVTIHYSTTGDTFLCGLAVHHIPVIHIIDISR